MRCLLAIAVASTLVSFTLRPCFADAVAPAPDGVQVTQPAADTSVVKPAEATKPSEAPVARTKAHPPVVSCPACAPPKTVVYVSDWERLAELTRSDSLIAGQADALAGRNQTVRDVAVGGVVLGGATAFLGAFHALSSDHWSRFDKGSVTVGAAVGALSLFISWLSDHNRDELYRLINQWNLRHPDQLLAP